MQWLAKVAQLKFWLMILPLTAQTLFSPLPTVFMLNNEATVCIATLLLQEITHLLCHHLTEVPSGTDDEVWGGEEAALGNVFLQQSQPP